jgi:hypothetical protein
MKLSKNVSTLKEKDLKPFWTKIGFYFNFLDNRVKLIIYFFLFYL